MQEMKVCRKDQMVEPKTHRKAPPPSDLSLQQSASWSACVDLSARVLTGDQKHSRNREQGSFHRTPTRPAPSAGSELQMNNG